MAESELTNSMLANESRQQRHALQRALRWWRWRWHPQPAHRV